MVSVGRRAIVAAGMALALARLGNAQETAAPADAGQYRIAGHIVSAVDGHPLQGATVEIDVTRTYRMVATVTADQDGGFAFPGLKAGKYVLQGRSPGYITSRLQEHNGFSTAVVTGAGVDTEALTLKLMPEAEIHGRVTDEAGDALRRATISLYFEAHTAEGVRIRRQRTAQTDDTGGYSIANLQEGRYYVAAAGRPWYAVHPPVTPQPANQFGVMDSLDPSLDAAYPLTFYPDTSDQGSAAPIALKAGEEAQIDIRMRPEQAVTVTFPRAPGEQNSPIRPLEQKVFDSLERVDGPDMQATPGLVSVRGVAPGQYVMREQSTQPGGISRLVTVDAAGRSVQVDPADGTELGNVHVLLKMADGTKLPGQASVTFFEDETQVATATANAKDEADLKGVKPGDYRVAVHVGPKLFYVSSVRAAGKEMPIDRWQVAAGESSAIVAIRPGRVTVEGFAMQKGKPSAGAMVLLLPANAVQHVEQFWMQQSDLDGSFDLQNVPSGNYTLLAIDDGWGLEWRKPEVLAHYLAKGAPVTVPEAGSTTLKLSDALEVQPR